jgi:hypothetical protein
VGSDGRFTANLISDAVGAVILTPDWTVPQSFRRSVRRYERRGCFDSRYYV